jgi:hypothetical protein
MAEKKKRRALSWAACKQAMRDWPRAGVIGLVQEMYQLSAENRQFLHARLIHDEPEATREDIAKQMRRMISPSAVFNNKFRHGELKRLVDRYEKATGNPAGVAELLLIDAEYSFETFAEVGDFEKIVDHLYVVLDRLNKTMSKMPVEERGALVERLARLAERWGSEFGYGISDYLVQVAEEWESDSE